MRCLFHHDIQYHFPLALRMVYYRMIISLSHLQVKMETLFWGAYYLQYLESSTSWAYVVKRGDDKTLLRDLCVINQFLKALLVSSLLALLLVQNFFYMLWDCASPLIRPHTDDSSSNTSHTCMLSLNQHY